MDRDQEHENQEGSKPTADAKLQDGEDSGDSNTVTPNDESLDETQNKGEKKLSEGTADAASENDREGMCDGVNPVTTKETANTSGESQSGGGALLKKDKNTVDTASKEEKESVSGIESVTGHSSTQSEKSTDETQNKRGSLPNDSNSLKTEEPAEDTTSNNEREKKSGEGNTDTASKDKRNNQSSDSDLLKNDKSAVDPASTDERKSQCDDVKPTSTDERNPSGHSDKDNPVVSDNQKRLMNDDRKEDKDFCTPNTQSTVSTKCSKEDKRQEETVEDQLRQSLEKSCNDIQKEYENVKKDFEEMERKFESISKEKEELLVKNNKITKELDGTIQASTDLVEKDIENQKMILELETKLPDIQKRYDDMAKQKSRVENQLKEEQKSWTQEKSRLQKDHDAESKKHKKEMEKANKAIGSLNQKVTDKDEELKKKKHLIDNLTREKKKVDEQNADNETYIQKLHEHIKKTKEQKITDEREHKKKIKDLTLMIQAERDNFNRLSYQYHELEQQIQSLQEENRSLTREKQELLLRLSKVAGANLTYNNPNIADLSDEKRPTKLAEEFSELYDNEWTDAFEDLKFENEKEKTTFMLELVMTASQLCSDVSSDHGQKIKDSLCTLVLPCKPSKFSKECTDEDIIPATIAPLEETNSSTPKQVGNVEDKEIEDSKQKAGNLPCTSENTSGSGKTKENVQETTENKKGKTADDTKQSPSIKDRENKDNKDEETADDTNQSPSKKRQETTENTEGTTADSTKQSPSNNEGDNKRDKEEKTADDANNPSTIKDRENKDNKDVETANDTNQSPSNKEQETTENIEGTTADGTKQSPPKNEVENKRDKEKKTADDVNNPSTESEQDTKENTENNEGEKARKTDTKQPPLINDGDDKENEEKETADDTKIPPSGNERGENTENKMVETTDDTKKPPSINEEDNKIYKEEKTADDANNALSVNEQENIENTEQAKKDTADVTYKPPSESKQDTTENTGNNEGGTAEKADTEQPASINEGDNKRNKKEETADGTKNPPSEDFVGRYDSDGPEQKKEHLSFTSKNTNGDVNGPGKAEQVDVGGDEDKENPEKPGKKQMLTSENTNGDEFDPHMTKVNERKTKEKEENEEEEIKATSSKHTLQGDIVGDDNKERVEKQDEKHMLLTSENTNGIEFDPNNEGLSQPENEVADSGLLSREQGSMNTNDKENDASHANKQGDAVIPGADNTPEAKNDPQSENRVQATDDKSKDITKEENTATYSAKVDDTPEAKESEANVVKETEKEEAVKKIRLESNFEKLLQKEQKKIIMDAKKLVEQHLSEEIEKAGTDLIVQENGIDTEKQESVVNYIKKCVNICWSMHRNEPPVFVEFPDITENVVFDTNKFKPYTKSGKYIDYIVWPAVYLHEGGPLLCKGVAQGRK